MPHCISHYREKELKKIKHLAFILILELWGQNMQERLFLQSILTLSKDRGRI